MGNPCTIQQRSDRPDIDASIRNGVSNRRIAATYGISEASVRRHAKHLDVCFWSTDAPTDAALVQPTQSTDARLDHIETNMGELTGYWRTLDAVLLPTLRQVLVALQSKPAVPDEPSPTLIDRPELDTEGLTPVDAMRLLVRGIHTVLRKTPRREQRAPIKVLQEGLQGIASDEEWGA